jgi:putative restriction endonuclease
MHPNPLREPRQHLVKRARDPDDVPAVKLDQGLVVALVGIVDDAKRLQQMPVIYFLGTSPCRYQPIIPTFIAGWHPERLRVDLAFEVIVGASAQARLPASPERRYALREIKARFLHQASFRDAVLSAYRGRCAISHLPEPRLLDAAHIVMDADEQLGQPVISNGLPLTKLHHAAFDAHLIGIDPDYRIHVSDRLLEIHDGPFLELGLKGIAGKPDRQVETA